MTNHEDDDRTDDTRTRGVRPDEPNSLTAGGRPVVWAPDIREYRRRKYELAQENLRRRYQDGRPLPRIR